MYCVRLVEFYMSDTCFDAVTGRSCSGAGRGITWGSSDCCIPIPIIILIISSSSSNVAPPSHVGPAARDSCACTVDTAASAARAAAAQRCAQPAVLGKGPQGMV